ncbi:MAG TPA: hypothetical protein VH682_10835 [Gemmataceae bacterium]|jgi:hypothetical protein
MIAPADPKPRATVFYSWQSDLPNPTNRSLILDALERAAKKIRTDESITVEPVLDRDTQNVPGAPDIAHTIFQKIEKATAFVADVSIINPGMGRPTPNPNVLIELGYALKTLGNPRTVLVANTANGPVESLPFDLRTKRVLTYHLPLGAEDKPDQRRKLQEGLEAALRAILLDLPTPQTSSVPSAADKAIESIEEKKPSQSALCTRFMSGIADRVRELTPKLEREKINEWDDELVEAIRQSLPLVTDFARVADAVALHDSREAALGLFRGFAPLLAQYKLAPGTPGQIHPVQFDFFKFIGNELMVTLFAALIREDRWNTVAKLCQEPIMIPNPDVPGPSQAERTVTYLYASKNVELLDHRSRRLKLNRVSLHADILKERHKSGQLGELSPWRRFQDADVFLYLRSFAPEEFYVPNKIWLPWSAALLDGASPRYLVEATHREKAEQLLEPLGVPDIVALRNHLAQAAHGLRRIFNYRNLFNDPLEGLRPDLIGTK